MRVSVMELGRFTGSKTARRDAACTALNYPPPATGKAMELAK